ncbi:MAG: fumarate hydratase [Candidatus Bathyarchaeota archaeon]|nr:fumarate hydratase [Candidatus Bathyarchaeota archaeon]
MNEVVVLGIVCELLESVAFELIRQAVVCLPDDVLAALKKAYAKETSEVAMVQLKAILDNVELAKARGAPICQDTGTLTFYVRAGEGVADLSQVKAALERAVQKATVQVPLRPNAVEPFTQKNSGDNTGRGLPLIHWEIVPGDGLEVTVMPKGGGSENVCVLGMLNPREGINGVKRFVIDAVVNAGAKPCPPTILGVAFGGAADTAMELAKKTLLRPLDTVSTNPQAAALEKELLEAVNLLGVGPMGLGGKTTVLGVHVDYAFRHPASYPVAVAFSCWACRRATAHINPDGTVEYLTHKQVGAR